MDVDDLKRLAFERATAGDLSGQLEALRQADQLGDAEAAILLGNVLRTTGDLGLARTAFERAETRGHREAAMSLGNLLGDLGDNAGAKAAYRRSIELGSTIAVLNLGLMLAEDGEHDEALVYLHQTAESGDPAGFWGIGRVHEGRNDWDAAALAYQEGANLGDASCFYGLGVALYQQGDREGSKAALRHASNLSHPGAPALLDAIEREEIQLDEGSRATVGELWSNARAVREALAKERQELGRQWIAATLNIQERQARLAVLVDAEKTIRERLTDARNRFMFQFQNGDEQKSETSIPASSPSNWLRPRPGHAGAWSLADSQSRAFDAELNEASTAFVQAGKKTFGRSLRERGTDALNRVSARLNGLVKAVAAASQELREAERDRESTSRASADRARETLSSTATLAASSALGLPTILQPWSSPAWEAWSLDDAANRGLRLAFGGLLAPKHDPRLGVNSGFGADIRIPWGISLHDNWCLQHDGSRRGDAHSFMRSIMLRHLVAVEPGKTRFCVFDPVGLGQSAGDLLDLAEYDADIIGGKVWSTSQDLDAKLVDLTAHIELIIQKYLRATYSTIDEFNDAAGEVAEPYRILVLFDFPSGLTPESAARLKSVVENGPRCGVFTLIASDRSSQTPYGVDTNYVTSSMKRIYLQGDFSDDVNGYQLEATLEHDQLPERSEITKRVIDSVGRASIAQTESAVTFDKVFSMYNNVASRGLRSELSLAATRTMVSDPSTWWADDSTRGLYAPIGQRGARDVAILGFDSSDHAGALLVGRPGSGKSTLLHTYIGGLTSLYGPEDLELYLIDFKEGVEFKAYAEEGLPHAKVIAIESDREFGLSVLESLQAEITQRAELLRSTGGRQTGMQGLREATGNKMSRILLVFDEFQVLFARNDKVGLAAADLLESIIRQGRGFGVHVLLGSQSLAGLDALGAHVPQLLPVRILLPAAEADARKVLGDSNDAGDYLTSHGEGILNTAGGAVEANERFKGALLTETERVARLRLMRLKANQSGFTRVPMVFEGNSLVRLDSQTAHQFREELASSGRSPVRIRSGVPMTVGDVGDLLLPREAGANVLAIVRSGENDTVGHADGPAYGLLAAAVASAAMTNATVDVIDFMFNDDGLDELFEPLLNAKRIGLKRRRAFPDVLSAYLDEVNERIDADESNRPVQLLFLFGVHRARDLDSEFGSLEGDTDLVENLERLMREGPDVGVHVWLWSDSVAGASRRLTPRMMREVGWRIAGRMSGDDSQTFIGAGHAAELRDSQLLMVNEDRGISTRVSAYAPPSREWLTHIMQPTLND